MEPKRIISYIILKNWYVCMCVFKCECFTDNFKAVGKKDDLLGATCSVGPEAEQWSWEQAAEAERWQTETQKIWSSVQRLQETPDRR